MPTGSLPRIIQLQDGSYATPDGKGGWAPYTGQLPDGTSAATNNPNAFKVGDTDEISHTWDLIDSINAARGLARKPLATGMPAQAITSVPVIGGVVGQNRANLQVKLGSIAGALRQMGIKQLYEGTGQKGVGSIARNQSEQQALQNSLAPLGYVDQGGHLATGPSPDEATLDQGLGTAQNLFLRHQARLMGMNPDDPNVMQALTSAATDPSKRQLLLNSLKTSGTAAPAANAGAAAPPTTLETSTTDQAHLNPAVAKIAPQLTKMLDAPKWRVPDAQILDFVRQNGIDPDSWKELQDALPNRGKTQFSVDPHFNTPLTGVKKVMSEVGTATPGGVPIGPALVGAGDAYLLGAAPDIAGIIHAVTGAGPTRDDVVQARDASAAENPAATFFGNMAGMAANPLARGGGALRTMGLSGLYGGLSSDDSSVGSRLTNAGIAATIGGITHGLISGGVRGGQAGFRALKGIVAPILGNGEQVATDNALARAAAAMPKQDPAAVAAALAAGKATGVPVPAAAALSRGGQEFLSHVASSSPAARAAADTAVSTFRKAVPKALEDDFNQAIAAATPADTPFAKETGAKAADFLNRPVRDIAGDVQDMAGREYETGMAPIKNDQVPVDESLADTLSHEQIKPAIADVLRNSKLSPETQAILRSMPQWIKDGMLTKMPITVDALRHLATNLDMRAAKSGNYVAGDLSAMLRDKIGETFPEYKPVNSLYSSRMRAIDAMHAARENFLGESPEQIDALAKAGEKFTDAPNPPEFKGVDGAEPSGPVLPSNRQFAAAGAREAATNKAGAGTGANGASLLRQIAEGPNQGQRNSMVLGPQAASVAARAGVRANVAETVDRIASGPNTDQTASWFKLGKYALTTKLTGGAAHYAAARALTSIPNMSAEDAARITRVYMDADSADQVVRSLTKHYGAARARTIMARVAAIGAAGAATRQPPRNPPPAPGVIGAPVSGGN